MIHPSIDLDKLTAQLKSIGFAARTKLLFRRGFVDVMIVNGLMPGDLTESEKEAFAPFFRITICDKTGDIQGSFTCPIDGFTILEFGQL